MFNLTSRLLLLATGLVLGLWPAAGIARESALDQLTLPQVQQFFSAAESLEAGAGELPTRAVLGKTGLLGYVFLSDDIAPIPAYSGRPVRILVALGTDARIKGAEVLQHDEPILVIGISTNDLQHFIDQYMTLDAHTKVRVGAHNRAGVLGVDGITGATITAMVLNSSIMRSAQLVANELKLPLQSPTLLTTDQIASEVDDNATVGVTSPVTNTVISTAVNATPANASTNAIPDNAASDFEEPLWLEHWREQAFELGLLAIALVFLMVVLFFQDWLVVRPKLFQRVRIGYLLFTLLYLGVWCKAQLSVINMISFMRALFGGFSWETLLIDPVIFLLWGFVAVSIILWGRGVFCGWLCPFGAAQELIHKIAQRLQWPSWEFPAMVHERLWAIKYFILIALVGLSLESMQYAARVAEVEPFKTVFVLRLQRDWLFVIYAIALLGLAIFNSKFYCKYLCPLGAALSFFTRFRIFDWLRRHKECGHPCQSCATQCQIAAIKPTGEIIENECHYCLECQITYWDEQRCPPMVDKRKRRERREHRSEAVIASDQNLA